MTLKRTRCQTMIKSCNKYAEGDCKVVLEYREPHDNHVARPVVLGKGCAGAVCEATSARRATVALFPARSRPSLSRRSSSAGKPASLTYPQHIFTVSPGQPQIWSDTLAWVSRYVLYGDFHIDILKYPKFNLEGGSGVSAP